MVGMIMTIIGLGLTMLQWRGVRFLAVPLPPTSHLVRPGVSAALTAVIPVLTYFPLFNVAGILAGFEPRAATADERLDVVGGGEHDDRDRGDRHSGTRLGFACVGGAGPRGFHFGRLSVRTRRRGDRQWPTRYC